jgi:hypothetical protein
METSRCIVIRNIIFALAGLLSGRYNARDNGAVVEILVYLKKRLSFERDTGVHTC